MTQPPPGAEAGRGSRIAVVGGDQSRNGDEVIGVGRVAQAEHEGDPERDQQWRAVKEAGKPRVELLDRAKEELEIDTCHVYLRWWVLSSAAQRRQRPTIGKCEKRASKPKR